MLNLANKTLLVIAPHPDDEVIGCGGLITKIKSLGGKVYVLYLTVGNTVDFTKKGLSTTDERLAEIKKVTQFLNIDGWRIAFPGDKYHLQLDTVSQKKLIHEVERGEKISLENTRPDIIAFPMSNDYNQDHRAAAQASFAACRPTPKSDKFVPDLILSYDTPMNEWVLENHNKLNFFVHLTEKQFSNKMKALGLYKSQARSKGHLRSEETVKAMATSKGALIGSKLAEGYYCHKLEG
jgi:LmbE family N-acetylglucosaminyl deacetylase